MVRTTNLNKFTKTATYILLFLANLYSKDDKARSEAADACKRLASKISDQKTVEDILKKCFDVLHGSEGKLTVVDYKMSVLQVIFLTINMIFITENMSIFFLGCWKFQFQ